MTNYNFGANYTGRASVWSTEFTVDQMDVFTRDSDTVALLKEDADLIPMIVGLTESVDMEPACTQTGGPNCNICFRLSYLDSTIE